jgi:hypothetical protein
LTNADDQNTQINRARDNLSRSCSWSCLLASKEDQDGDAATEKELDPAAAADAELAMESGLFAASSQTPAAGVAKRQRVVVGEAAGSGSIGATRRPPIAPTSPVRIGGTQENRAGEGGAPTKRVASTAAQSVGSKRNKSSADATGFQQQCNALLPPLPLKGIRAGKPLKHADLLDKSALSKGPAEPQVRTPSALP